MGGSDGAFQIYLRTFKVREEMEAIAKHQEVQATPAIAAPVAAQAAKIPSKVDNNRIPGVATEAADLPVGLRQGRGCITQTRL